jgi:D-alanine-D-alanine ligase
MIDKSNQLYILEINTIPGMTEQSLYPKSAAVAGLSMPELVKFFVDMAGRDSRAG